MSHAKEDRHVIRGGALIANPKLSEAGFLDLLREIQRRCVEPESENITLIGRKAVHRINKAVEAYMTDLGWNL